FPSVLPEVAEAEPRALHGVAETGDVEFQGRRPCSPGPGLDGRIVTLAGAGVNAAQSSLCLLAPDTNHLPQVWHRPSQQGSQCKHFPSWQMQVHSTISFIRAFLANFLFSFKVRIGSGSSYSSGCCLPCSQASSIEQGTKRSPSRLQKLISS